MEGTGSTEKIPVAAIPPVPELAQVRLRQLYRYLTVEASTLVLFFAWFIVPPAILLLILTALAVLFTPYMLTVLFLEKRYGWIAGFVLIVGGATAASLLPAKSPILDVVLTWAPLFLFYGYCWSLRIAIADWLD